MKEHIEAMKQIWTRDEAAYDGEFVAFPAMWSWPKPVQRPHPPVLIAGNGPKVLDRVIAYGDGWLPNYEPDVLGRVRELLALAADSGLEVAVAMTGTPPDPAALEQCAEAGVSRALTWLPSAGLDEIEADMEAFERALSLAGLR